MALNESVNDALLDAEGNLRQALFMASKNERPFVCKAIADIIVQIESLKVSDTLLDKLESRKPGDSGFFGSFYKDE